MARTTTKPAIQTSTEWADAGYDCDHCGGRILRRTDHETGLRDRTCYQCEQCSCQWTLERRPLRVGTKAQCRQAQRQRAAEADEGRAGSLAWVYAVLGLVVLLAVARFGGVGLLRLLWPVAVVALVVAAVLYARRRGLW